MLLSVIAVHVHIVYKMHELYTRIWDKPGLKHYILAANSMKCSKLCAHVSTSGTPNQLSRRIFTRLYHSGLSYKWLFNKFIVFGRKHNCLVLKQNFYFLGPIIPYHKLNAQLLCYGFEFNFQIEFRFNYYFTLIIHLFNANAFSVFIE
jgi:hypothetical protein